MTTKIDLTPAVIDEIVLYQGDDEGFIVSFTDDTDAHTAIDVSHLTWTSQIRQTRDSETVYDLVLDTTDAVNGNLVVSIPATITAVLPRRSVWDLRYIPTSGTTVTTVLQCNKVKCEQNVTRSP